MLGQFDDDSVKTDSPEVKNVNFLFFNKQNTKTVNFKSNITLTASDRICRRPVLCVQT